MSAWCRFHLDETVKAMAIPENNRFLVHMREPPGGNRYPVDFYRSNLQGAQEAADRLVQEYYPHECDEERCGEWRKYDS